MPLLIAGKMSEKRGRINGERRAGRDMSDKVLAMLPDIACGPVLIAGPTASGKSALALAIAQRFGGVIVNADAMQVFAPWRVLTARPRPADEAQAVHALYGHIAPGQPYSVGHWLREVAALLPQGQRLIIVGGTGLYFSALTDGLVEIPAIPAVIRAEGDERVRDLPALLAELDDRTRAALDPANPARVQRAWEVWRATGRGLADWQADTAAPLVDLAQATPIVLTGDKAWLEQRIGARFDAMMADGALAEVQAALPYWDGAAPWAKAIGARELVAHLRGESSLPLAVAQAKISTRQYAKRQRTWFRARMKSWHNLKV